MISNQKNKNFDNSITDYCKNIEKYLFYIDRLGG